MCTSLQIALYSVLCLRIQYRQKQQGTNRGRRLVRRQRERERWSGELQQVERQRERQDWCRVLDEVDDNPGGACPSALFSKLIRK